MTQFTVEGTPLPADWTPPQRKQKQQIVRSYVFSDRTPNLIDQMSLITSMSKTEVVSASVELAAMLCNMSKELLESAASQSPPDTGRIIGAVLSSLYKQA